MEQLTQQLFDFLSGAGKEAALFIVSMIPLIELRGAVPLGALMGMEWWKVFAISVVGNLIPVPFVLLLGRPIFGWLKKTRLLSGFAHWYENKLLSKADKVRRYEAIGLCLFVGIPLPGTGACSGAGLAALLGLRMRSALLAIAGGVVLAGIIMTLGAYGVVGFFSLF